MISVLIQVLSTIGGALILGGFWAGQKGKVTPQDTRYLLANYAGSGCLLLAGLLAGVSGFVLLDAFWVGMAVYALCSPALGLAAVLASGAAYLAGPGLTAASTGLVQAVSLAGGALVLLGFAGGQRGWWSLGSRPSLAINAAGALLLLIAGVATRVWGAAALDLAWLLISGVPLVRSLTTTREG